MPNAFSYDFVNGFVDTGDLPCRKAWKAVDCRQGPLPADLVFAEIYSALHGANIDFSDFQPRPVLTRRYLRTYVTAELATELSLQVSTCGVVQLWCDDRSVLNSVVQTRNESKSVDVTFGVAAGEHTMTVMLEELHERDTRCFFSAVLIGAKGLSQSYFARTEQARENDLRKQLAHFNSVRTALIIDTSDLRFHIRDSAEHGFSFRLTKLAPTGRGGLWDLVPPGLDEPIDVVILPAELSGCVHLPGDLPGGSVEAIIEMDIDGYHVERKLGMVFDTQRVIIDGLTVAERKRQAIRACYLQPGYDPSTAQVLMSRDADAAFALLERTLVTIEERQDCSDFNLLELFWFVRHATRLPRAVAERLEYALLGYRYWLDEPGNDVMWFWSENHALCFHVAQALAGQYFPKRRFSNSDRTGSEQRALGETRLRHWFDAVERQGLAEFNSSAYYPIDLLALLTLYDHSADVDLQTRARNLLDEICAMVALHTLGGTPAGAQGRAYEKELLAGVGTELGSVSAILFGGQLMPGFDRAAMLLCLSDYEPPAQVHGFAQPAAGTTLMAHYRQGGNSSIHANGHLRCWKDAHVQLSTATGYPVGSRGHQQHLIDIQFADASDARAWINHPGDATLWGEQRPAYLAGNLCLPRIAQQANHALVLFDLDKAWNSYHWVNLFAQTRAIDVHQSGRWLMLRCGDGFAGIWCSVAPVSQNSGQGAGCIWHCQGDRIALSLSVSSSAHFDSWHDFQNACLQQDPVFDERQGRVSTSFNQVPVALDLEGPLMIDSRACQEQADNLWPHVSTNLEPMRYWRDG